MEGALEETGVSSAIQTETGTGEWPGSRYTETADLRPPILLGDLETTVPLWDEGGPMAVSPRFSLLQRESSFPLPLSLNLSLKGPPRHPRHLKVSVALSLLFAGFAFLFIGLRQRRASFKQQQQEIRSPIPESLPKETTPTETERESEIYDEAKEIISEVSKHIYIYI